MIIGVALVLLIVVIWLAVSRGRSISKDRIPRGARTALPPNEAKVFPTEVFPTEVVPTEVVPTENVITEKQSALHPYIASLLERWTTAGVLTAESAERIRNFETQIIQERAIGARVSPRKFPAIAEALGYLGGVLGIVGVITLVSNYWSDWASGLRLGTTGGVTLLLVVAGRIVREQVDPALARLRWFLWTVATPAVALFAYVLAHEVLNWERASQYWLMIALIAGCLNGLLWAGQRRPIQESLFFLAMMVVIGTAVGDVVDATGAGITEAGIAVWASGIALVAFTLWRKIILPLIPAAVGAGSIIVGAYLTVTNWEGLGFLFVVVSAAVLVGSATAKATPLPAPFRVLFGIVGSIGLVQSLPGALVYFAKDAGLMTGLAVWVSGVLLFVLSRVRLVQVAVVFQIVGGVAVLVGPAITGVQSLAVATISGLIVAIGLIAWGSTPGQVLMSMFGLVGLLVYVPWTIAHFFPGEGRVPLLITVSGLLIVVIAVVLARMSGRIRSELQTSDR